jgi:hypothetical protein
MKPTIALFLCDPRCSVQSGNGVMNALKAGYNFKIFSKGTLEDNFFDGVDMVAVPGGIGDADRFDVTFKHNLDRVRKFVHNGGRYLGICMGAYWAGKDYFNILDDADAVQYIKQPNTDTRRPHSKAIAVTWNGQPKNMFFYDGCAIVGDKSKFKTIATYANGDAMAIIQNRIGLIGCHLESEEFWYDKKYLKKHWHYHEHHLLLSDFVDKLMEQ